MSFENLSEVLWSTPGGGTSILGLLDPRNTTLSSTLFLDSSNSISHFSSDGGGGGGASPQHNYAAGISIAVATSIVQSLGLTLQRKSHVLNEAIHPKELRRTACQQPLWHFGFYTYILSNIIGTLFSIGYLPVIILAPLGAVTLVFNAVFARLFLGDVFSRQSVLGTLLILLGAVMIGLFGIVPEPSHSLEDLIQLWRRPGFIIYFSMIEFAVVSLLVTCTVTEQILKRDAKANLAHSRYRSGSLAGGSVISASDSRRTMFYGSQPPPQQSYYSKLISGRIQQRNLTPARIKTMLGISYGCVSGLLSSQTLLIAKSAIELLMLTLIEGDNQFENPLSWFLVVALISAALLQLYYLNKGLKLCDTVLLVPLSFCVYNVSCLFNGLVYYDQWGRLHWWQILLVLFGISQVLIGVLVLAWRPTPEDNFDEGMGSDESTLLLPNPSSLPTTPRHSRGFSFKGISSDGSHATPGMVGHHLRHDPSIDAMNLIQGFEMYDSDEDDARTNVMDHATRPLSSQQQPQQEQELINLSDGTQGDDYSLSSAQSLRELSFAPGTRSFK
ncbi:MAG: magnesium transporter NIPA-domain-containing protein [Benniella sp.]|nr:MAG: magnesium transporter NIPA-domain-containing protein [Benniella sp.]